MKKLVLTGAAGSLGSRLRAPLAAMCDELVSTDIVDSVEGLAANETYVKADLADMAAHGARACLIAESLMRQADVTAATAALLSDPVPA